MLEFIVSGILAIIGAIVGSLITYYTQKHTQERAWKREYGVEIAEEVYGSLFAEIKGIIRSLEDKWYRQLSLDAWREMQDDHRYFMVDEKFRTKLDELFQRVQDYNMAVYKLENIILPKIVNEETKRVFNVDTDEHARLEVKYVEGSSPHSGVSNTIRCLISQTHPKDDVLRGATEFSNVECLVNVRRRDGTTFHDHDMEKFNQFWESCLRRMKEDKTYNFIIEENEKLLKEARNLKKEIVKRIEEPWKI